MSKRLGLIGAAATLALLVAADARAQMALTPAGTSAGFTLSTFFTPTTNIFDYQDIANVGLPDGNLLGVGWATGTLFKFSNTDGQTPGSALLTNTSSFVRGQAVNATVANGVTYLAQYGAGYYTVSNNLTVTPVPWSTGLSHTYGLWTNPVTQHLVAATTSGVADINPSTGAVAMVASCGNCAFDGVTVSPNGSTVYAETGGGIQAYNLTGPNTWAPGTFYSFGHGPDGTAVITGGLLDGQIVVNNTDGTIGLLNPSNSNYITIAQGGDRGDFVSAMPGGTLSVSNYAKTYRLGLDSGSIGSAVPEPASIALLALGLAGLGAARRRR